jgi:Ca-activated chloride channel family protein
MKNFSQRGMTPMATAFLRSPFRTLTTLTLAAFLAGGAAIAPAQDRSGKKPPRPDAPSSGQSGGQKDEVISVGTDLVVMDVSVFDQNNRFVADLKQDVFKIYENQVEQKIEYFSRDEAPVSLGFVIDTSGSMRSRRNEVIEAVKILTRSAKRGDEFFLVDFKNKPELAEEFTPRAADIDDAVDNIVWSGGTALIDAVQVSAEYANKEGKNRRKAIIVISDGDERDSYYSRQQIVKLMQEYDVQVYIIGITDDLDSEGGIFKKSTKAKATGLINQIATETGGRSFFPQSNAEIVDIARQINADLRTQYSIGFTSTNDKKDGTFRKITIRVDDGKRKLVARSRNGYTAPKGQ